MGHETMTNTLARTLSAILRGCFIAVSPMNWKIEKAKAGKKNE
jgi:hypothetical protein